MVVSRIKKNVPRDGYVLCRLFCLFCKLYGLDGVWDLDAFFAEADGEGFDEFVAEDAALGDVVGGEDDVEVDA